MPTKRNEHSSLITRVASIQASKQNRKYVRELETELGNLVYWTNQQNSSVAEFFKANPIKLQGKPPKPRKSTKSREIVSFISDTHFGLDIDANEVPQSGYSWTKACRRMGKFAEEVGSFKIENRGMTPQLRLCLGGDLIQGIIHTSDSGTHLITTQIYGATSILMQFIDYLRNFFSSIRIECTPCNHARLTHKDTGPATAQKWDAYSTMIHIGLESAFRHEKDVSFNIPQTPYTNFRIFNHEFMLTHGDTFFHVGNVSKSVNIESLTAQVNALSASRALNGDKPVNVVMLGHVHTPLFTTLKNDTELVINGTGSGLDPYAQSIGIHSHQPVQTIFEVTPEHSVGDYRKIHLLDADNNPKYDKIIKNNVRFLSPLNRS